MPEKKPLQSGELIRGGDNLTVPQPNLNCNIPPAVISRLEREMHGVDFGGVSLVIAIRDGRPTFRIEKTVSIMAGA